MTGGDVNHLLPSCEGGRGPLGDILFVDELAVTVTTGKTVASVGCADEVLMGELGDGMSFWLPV